MNNSKELALKAARILDQKGANDIDILEVGHLTSITDFFVIANGRNIQSVRSLAEDLEEKLAEEGVEPRRKDGTGEGRWAVLDYGTVMIHIFHEQERAYYQLERLWADGTNAVPFEQTEA